MSEDDLKFLLDLVASGDVREPDGQGSAAADPDEEDQAIEVHALTMLRNQQLAALSAGVPTSGPDDLVGSGGNDAIDGLGGNDAILGGGGNDELFGGDGNDDLSGGEGNDLLDGGADHDQIFGDAGHDELHGGSGNDVLHGGAGNDALHGGTGHDELFGEAGHDELHGDAGNDHLSAGAGDDELQGGAGDDELDGGEGEDTAVFSGARADYDVTTHQDGTTTVSHRNGGADGTDVFTAIEQLQFSDQAIVVPPLVPSDEEPGDNSAPTVTAIGNQTAHPGAQFSFSAASHFADPDAGDTLRYSISGPSWLSINPVTGVVTGTPPTRTVSHALTAAGDGGYVLPASGVVQIAAQTFAGEAAYHSSFGYYLAGADGKPIGGAVIENNVKTLGPKTTTIDLDDYPGAVKLGFFIIPDSAHKNGSLGDGQALTFQLVNGSWAAYANGVKLNGEGASIYFSDAGLNGDGLDHLRDNGNSGNQNWEDLRGGGDNDFDDTNVAVTVSTIETLSAGGGGQVTITATDRGGLTAQTSFQLDVAPPLPGQAHIEDDTPGNGSLTLGQDQPLNVQVVYNHEGVAELRYQWQSSADGQNWSAIPGATNARYTPRASDTGNMLRVALTYIFIDAAFAAQTTYSEATEHVPPPPESENTTTVAPPTDDIGGGNGGDGVDTAHGGQTGDTPDDTPPPTDNGGGGNNGPAPELPIDTHVVQGDGGDNHLTGSSGSDAVYAGDGNDVVYTGKAADILHGGEGNDWLYGGRGNDTVFGEGGDDHLFGGQGNDTLYGGTGNDHLYGGRGDDLLAGGVGDDTLAGDQGNDVLDGGDGNDTEDGGSGDDTLSGGAGNDALTGGHGHDTLDGGDGHDALDGGSGNDTLAGGAGDDTLSGGSGVDTLSGGTGDDVLSGGSGNDSLDGGDGKDTLDGGSGADALAGGAGQDALSGGDGGDLIKGNADSDTLYGGSGNDALSGGSGDDTLTGGDGSDILAGGADADTLYGGDGSDALSGGTGDDTLYGGGGDDTILGGVGNDILYGGDGQDRFVYRWGDGDDSIMDFEDDYDHLDFDGDDLTYAVSQTSYGRDYTFNDGHRLSVHSNRGHGSGDNDSDNSGSGNSGSGNGGEDQSGHGSGFDDEFDYDDFGSQGFAGDDAGDWTDLIASGVIDPYAPDVPQDVHYTTTLTEWADDQGLHSLLGVNSIAVGPEDYSLLY
ncbi:MULTISPECIES: putative Ig domain-containing protein [Rhodomicrobium]|uniref:putative Ig domain-containing protein n=1 Tax=Rhodomicrobium TaxID=1068 RepID=UPI001482291B|nr:MULTISPECIES: putative Ig domain-containing protein [Rhodomicrobium]